MPIDTPAMRRKIQSRKAPVWVAIGGNRAGLKLGYRKGARGGVWIAKSVAANRRRETTLGLADDDNAGPGALSFTAAIAAALEWGARERACCRAARGDYTRPTVASAARVTLPLANNATSDAAETLDPPDEACSFRRKVFKVGA